MYLNDKDAKVFGITSTGRTILVDLRNTARIVDEFSVEVKGDAVPPTTLVALLEVSLDGVNFTSLKTLAETDDSKVWCFADKPIQLIVLNVTSLVLGAATKVDCYVMAS